MPFREEPDWEPEPEQDDWFCAGCRAGHGCDGDPECPGRHVAPARPKKLEDSNA